jgi:plastocyanin
MRISIGIVTVSLLATSLAVLAPAVGALDLGCARGDANGDIEVTTLPAGSATLFTPPGSDVTGWTPECVIIPNGGTVTFVQRDAIGHGVVSDASGCVELGVMSVLGGTPATESPGVTTLTIEFDALEGVAYALQNGNSDIRMCSELEQRDNVLLIPYHCAIHGPGMPGLIKVEL